MSQATLVIQVFKQLLKSQNKTYRDVSAYLGLSEASIKRMFAQEQLTLERMDKLCALLSIEISDLLHKMQQMSKRISQLTWEQEQIIVSDRKLCLVTICVVNHWRLEEILNYYNLSEYQCIQHLAQLDKLKIIELLPKNKIKLLISAGFHWIPNGPIQQFFQQYILHDFTGSNFQNENEEMACQFGMLTEESNTLFRKKLRYLAQEFRTLSEQDAGESLQKRFGTACVLMVRPWAPAIFKEFIKKQT